MATLQTYRAKRDFGKTAEPRGTAARKQGLSLRHPEARRDAAALRSAARARRRDAELGGDARPEPRAGRQAARHPRRGSSDRIQQVRRHDPEGPIRRRHRDGLGPRHLDAGARSAQGHEEGPSRFRAAWREAQRPLAPGADAQAPRRAAGAVAPDQGDRRVRARESPIRTSWKRCRTPPPPAGPWTRSPPARRRSGIRTKREQPSGRQDRSQAPPKAAIPRARTPRRKATAKRDSKKTGKKIAGAREARLPDFVAPCLATLSSAAPDSRRLGP